VAMTYAIPIRFDLRVRSGAGDGMIVPRECRRKAESGISTRNADT